MTKKYKELVEIDKMVGDLYGKNPKLKETKFGYAYKRYYEKTFPKVHADYNQILADIRIDNALTDPQTQAVLLDNESNRGFKYSKEGLKSVLKDEKRIEEELQDTDVEISTYFIKAVDIPKELTKDIQEMLLGIIIEKKK
jgi:hypothetical protein